MGTLNEGYVNIGIDQRCESDVKYIENEIICKQPNGNYCKYSNPLGAVSIYDFTAQSYYNYWIKQYKEREDLKDKILAACEHKLNTNLTDVADMIVLVQKSNDRVSEKEKILKLLGVKDVCKK